MTWNPITPRIRSGNLTFADAVVGVNRMSGGSLSIALNPQKLPKTWRDGMMLSAAIGAGEHYRKLRLAPNAGAAFVLYRRRKGHALHLILPKPAGIEQVTPGRAPCRMVLDGDAVIIDLPDWAVPKPPKPVDVTAALMGDPTSPRAVPAPETERLREIRSLLATAGARKGDRGVRS